jgi:hypothetical protein
VLEQDKVPGGLMRSIKSTANSLWMSAKELYNRIAKVTLCGARFLAAIIGIIRIVGEFFMDHRRPALPAIQGRSFSG